MDKKVHSKENAITLFTIANTAVLGLFFLLMIILFFNQLINYFFKGYIIIVAIYYALLIMFGMAFDIFELGNTRVRDLLLSYVLTTIMTNILIYFIMDLIAYRMLIVYPLLALQALDILFSTVVLFYENRYIRDSFPIPKAIAIFGEPNYEILDKIYRYRDIIVKVEKRIDVKDIDFDNLDEFLDGYERVITVDVDHNDKKLIFKKCYEKYISVYDIPSIADTLIASSNTMHVIDTPILKINKFGPSALELIVKRAIDILGSLTLLLIASPIMIVTALAIKMNDGGDIFFKQERLGKDGKPFMIYKFRSMIMNAEKNTGAVLAKEGDSRITKIGKIIRKTRIDELPQLINILNGDMTFVGPRPERPEMYDKITKEIPEFRYRLVVKAGLTGYAQIYGKYNTSMRDKLLLDIYYIENYSLASDIKLLIMTLKIVFTPESTEGVK